MHFGLKNASGESNFKCTFTSVKLFRCDFVITLLAFRPLLSKAVNRLLRIYNNKLKFPPLCEFLSPPYFTHDASCIMLNIDWTPLTEFEVSSLITHSKFTEGGLKFNFWSLDPNHAIFGGILSCLRWDLPKSIPVPNLKFLASPVLKIRHRCR